MSYLHPRFEIALMKAQAGHPLLAHIDSDAVAAEVSAKFLSMEWTRTTLGNDEYDSQVAQAIDRTLIMAGVTTERHFPVELHAAATKATNSIAVALHPKRSARRIGITDGTQIARLAAALAETLSLEKPGIPGLERDKVAQKISGMLFKEAISRLDNKSFRFPDLSDGDVLQFCREVFDGMRTKIVRFATA